MECDEGKRELEALLSWVSTLPAYQGMNNLEEYSTIKATLDDFKTSEKLVKLLQDLDNREFKDLRTVFGKPRALTVVIPKMKKYLRGGKSSVDYKVVQKQFPPVAIKEIIRSVNENNINEEGVRMILKLLLGCAAASPLKDFVISKIKEGFESQLSQTLFNLLEDIVGYQAVENQDLNNNVKCDSEYEVTKIQLENKLIRNQIYKMYQRNNDLQRLVFLLRAEKHGQTNSKKLQEELSMLEKRLNLEATEATRKENQYLVLVNKVARLSIEAKSKEEATKKLLSQNESLQKQTQLMEERLKNLPSEQEIHHLRSQATTSKFSIEHSLQNGKRKFTTNNKQLISNQPNYQEVNVNKSKTKNKDRSREQQIFNGQTDTDGNLKLKTYPESKRISENEMRLSVECELEDLRNLVHKLEKELEESREEYEKSLNDIAILTSTKIALLELLMEAAERRYDRADALAYMQSLISKLGTV